MGRDVLEAGAETPSKASDLYSWARRQAELLRAGRLAEIDPVAIAEEIDDVGEEEYHRLECALTRRDAASPEVGPPAGPAQPLLIAVNSGTSAQGPKAAQE